MKTINYIKYWLGMVLCGISLMFCSRYLQDYISPSQRWHRIDYIAYGVIILAAIMITMWQMRRREKEINTGLLPLAGIRMLLRFFLAFIFIYYGVAKLVGNQFFPLLYRWDKSVGQLSGMDKAWVFFGHSVGYKYFLGLTQIGASLLLFFRRTAFIGLLILLTIIGNIVFLNFAFDIPVKFDSCFYLLINIYLLLFYLRHWNAFIATHTEPPLQIRLSQKAIGCIVAAAMIGIITICFTMQLKARRKDTWKTALYGTYDVRSAVSSGKPAIAQNWKTFYFDIGTLLNMRGQNNKLEWADYWMKGKDSIIFESDKIFRGTYKLTQDSILILDGIIDKDSLTIKMVKRAEKKK